MFQGQLIGIYVAQLKADTLQRLATVEAVAGRGLIGDRYCLKAETSFGKNGHEREITLMEIEALTREYDLTLQPKRNTKLR